MADEITPEGAVALNGTISAPDGESIPLADSEALILQPLFGQIEKTQLEARLVDAQMQTLTTEKRRLEELQKILLHEFEARARLAMQANQVPSGWVLNLQARCWQMPPKNADA